MEVSRKKSVSPLLNPWPCLLVNTPAYTPAVRNAGKHLPLMFPPSWNNSPIHLDSGDFVLRILLQPSCTHGFKQLIGITIRMSLISDVNEWLLAAALIDFAVFRQQRERGLMKGEITSLHGRKKRDEKHVVIPSRKRRSRTAKKKKDEKETEEKRRSKRHPSRRLNTANPILCQEEIARCYERAVTPMPTRKYTSVKGSRRKGWGRVGTGGCAENRHRSFFSFRRMSRGFSEFTPGRLQSTLKARADKKRGKISWSLYLSLPPFPPFSTPSRFLLLSAVTVATAARKKNRGRHVNIESFPRQRDNGNLIAYLSFYGLRPHFSS